MDNVRVIVEVVAGLIPGKDPDPQYTRRYAITSQQWSDCDSSDDHGQLLADLVAKAQSYAGTLMMQPDRLNWVRTDWIWL